MKTCLTLASVVHIALLGVLSCKQAIVGTSGAPPAGVSPGSAPVAPVEPIVAPPTTTVTVTSVPVVPRSNANLTSYGILKTPAASYVNPMLTGTQTSDWCVCRNSGSSPHIGWDLGFGASNQSIAMANGVVKSKRLFSEACGYEVVFEDTGGARWTYLHLNKPSLSEGQVLFQGAIIGTHQTYPGKGCGTGPHLHLERHSAGAFGDKERVKMCAGGSKTCNYNAKQPLVGKRVLMSISEATALQEKNKKATQDAKGYVEGGRGEVRERSVEGDSDVLGSEITFLDTTPLPCAFNQPAARVATPPASTGSGDGGALDARVQETVRAGLPSFVELNLTTRGAANADNTCGAGPCVAAWTLYARTPRGWVVALADEGTRDVPVTLVAEQKLCWPEDHDGTWSLAAQIDTAGALSQAVVTGQTR